MSKNQLNITYGVIALLYLLLMYGAYQYAEYYSIKKSSQMRDKASEQLDSYFKFGKKYVDVAFNNYKVSYKQIPKPKPRYITEWEAKGSANYLAKANGNFDLEAMGESAKELNLLEIKKWEEEYGDVRSLYEIDIIPYEDYGRGWSVKVIEKIPQPSVNEGFMVYYLYPKFFAYKDCGYLWYDEKISIEDALQEALDFVVKNDKSNLGEFYSKGSTRGLAETICIETSNEYWSISEDSIRTVWWNDPNEISYFGSLYGNEKSIQSGSMFNRYYKVFFERTQPTTYTIKRVSQEVIDSRIFSLRCISWLVLTLVFAIPTIFLSLKINKQQKNNT